ncbi:MAG: DNA translocase FtsK [Longimicrobiales bacterium]|nr:DNA translocase FtsK [Longimicrobiales bacterium]
MATRKRRGGKRGGSKRSKTGSTERFLSSEQQREILGVGLLALALFVALALIPPDAFGPGASERFPSGNLVGPLGGVVLGLARAAVGLGAPLLPLLLALVGFRTGGWLGRWATRRLLGFVIGLLLLLPVGFAVWIDPGAGGEFGARIAEPLAGAIGWLGTTVLVGTGLVALSVGTIGWNPFRTLATGLVGGGRVAQRGVEAVSGRIETWRTARARRAAEAAAQAAALAEELPDPEWTGPETGEDGVDVAAGARGVVPVDGIVDPDPEGDPDTDPAYATVDPAPHRPDSRSVRTPDELLPDPADPRDLTGGELPSDELLTWEESEDRARMEKDLDRLGEVLVEKLRTFRVECELGGRTTGPMVTQFEVIPAPGVKVNKIANLDADLALAMKAPSVRIVAPIPGKGAVGVEIPNPQPEIVYLREILESSEYGRAKGLLPLALGKDLTGRSYVADLTKMPHLLIAGATGSGKSVCINTIITSLIFKHTPETLRLLMIDPKMVELSAYADLPHLRHPVITDPQDAAGVLKWAVMEMERRYQLLSVNGVRSLAEFNQRVRAGVTLRRPEPDGEEGDPDRHIHDEGPLPWIVVIVDELADLMMQVQNDIEKPLAQLAQKARAIGIHLIVATQRPSVNVITGLIKANFPTRIAFRVASKTDSRTILDMNGAEALLGNGDMLFLPPGQNDGVRIQGAFLSTEDTERLLGWYRRVAEQRDALELKAALDEVDILEELRSHEMAEAGSAQDAIAGDWDDLFRSAAEVCLANGGGSTSLLQRKLSIGYGRAARIADQLEEAGVLGPQDGSKPREVLITMDELDQLFPGT